MDEKRIEAAAKELVNALDRCADVINGAFQFAAIRVTDYTDAVKLIYGKELDALKRALAGEGEQASPACGDWRQGVSDMWTEMEPALVDEAWREKFAALTQRAELAESRVKELSKPVTDEEWKEWTGGYGMGRGTFNALISERAASKAPDSAPVGGKEGEQ